MLIILFKANSISYTLGLSICCIFSAIMYFVFKYPGAYE